MNSRQNPSRRKKRRLGLQSLEKRKLLAADFFVMDFDGFESTPVMQAEMAFDGPSGMDEGIIFAAPVQTAFAQMAPMEMAYGQPSSMMFAEPMFGSDWIDFSFDSGNGGMSAIESLSFVDGSTVEFGGGYGPFGGIGEYGGGQLGGFGVAEVSEFEGDMSLEEIAAELGVPVEEILLEDLSDAEVVGEGVDQGGPIEVIELSGDETPEELAAALADYLGEVVIVDLTGGVSTAPTDSESDTGDLESDTGDSAVESDTDSELEVVGETFFFDADATPEEIAEALGVDVEDIVFEDAISLNGSEIAIPELGADATPEEIAEHFGVELGGIAFQDIAFQDIAFQDIVFQDIVDLGGDMIEAHEFDLSATPEEIAEHFGVELGDIAFQDIVDLSGDMIEAHEFDLSATSEEIAEHFGIDAEEFFFEDLMLEGDVAEAYVFDSSMTLEEIEAELADDFSNLYAQGISGHSVGIADVTGIFAADLTDGFVELVQGEDGVLVVTSNGTDVNADGTTTPADGMLVLDHLSGMNRAGHLDVNDDQRVSALDALVVFNYVSGDEVIVTEIDGDLIAMNLADSLGSEVEYRLGSGLVDIAELADVELAEPIDVEVVSTNGNVERLFDQFLSDLESLLDSDGSEDTGSSDADGESDDFFADLGEDQDRGPEWWLSGLVDSLMS